MISKDEQTAVVKQAMELEASICNLKKEMSELKREKFKPAPKSPVKRTIQPDYSSLPKLNITFTEFLEDEIKNRPSWINKLFSAHPLRRGLIVSAAGFVLFLFALASSISFLTTISGIAMFGFYAGVIYWFIRKREYKAKKDEIAAQRAQMPAYIQAKTEADNLAKKQQAECDIQYAKEKEVYDTVTFPQYESERLDWNTKHDKRVQIVSDKLDADSKAQSELYEATKIIPLHYRDLKALEYIYQLMSTSDYDIKEAVNMYDKELQRQQEAKRIAEQQRANELQAQAIQLADEQNQLAYEQNALLDEQNAIAEKARKEATVAAAASAIQRHNTNKMLKNLTKK